jgi:hypothetical protein
MRAFWELQAGEERIDLEILARDVQNATNQAGGQ